MSSPLLGLSYLGFARGRPGAYSWQSFNTTTWNHLPEFFHSATAEDVATAGNLAAEAAPVLAALSGKAKAAFLRDIAARLAPDGLLVMSTPNRTATSRVLLVGAAEAVGYVPKGTHHWEDFITPEEFEALLAEAGLVVTAKQGIAWRPGKGLHLGEDMSLNYILSARRS